MLKQTGKKVKKARLQKGISVRSLAKRIGCTPPTITKFERGEVEISVTKFLLICKSLKIDLNSFYDLIELPEEKAYKELKNKIGEP